MKSKKETLDTSTPAGQYRAIIEGLMAEPEDVPITPDEETEIRRLVKDARMSRAAATAEVLKARPEEEATDKEAVFAQQAILRHRSYLPFVEAGLMTVYEAVREVGANRSADGRGQERE